MSILDEETGISVRKSTEECGANFDLTKFELCPSWLTWESWGDCEEKNTIQVPTSQVRVYKYTYNFFLKNKSVKNYQKGTGTNGIKQKILYSFFSYFHGYKISKVMKTK